METDVAVKSGHSLRGIKLFAGMPADAMAAIDKQCRWIDVGSKPIAVATEGQTEQIVFVVAGTIRVFAAVGGKAKALGEVEGGGLFGDLSPINGEKLSAASIGGDAGLVAIMPGETFRAVLLKYPPIAIRQLEALAAALSGASGDSGQGGGPSPRQRVFAGLIQLAVPNPIGDGSWLIDKVPNHDEIAAKSDTEKTEVAMAIGTLARDGIIERKHRTLVIRDHPRLTMLANM